MKNCHMIPWDLTELAGLLRLYIDIYAPDCTTPEDLLDEISQRIKELPEMKYTEKNPRGAGRHAKITLQQRTDVVELFRQNNSIRSIAKTTNLSIGSVHKLINEHSKTKSTKA